jgi:hypothetical protein
VGADDHASFFERNELILPVVFPYYSYQTEIKKNRNANNGKSKNDAAKRDRRLGLQEYWRLF